MTPPFPRLFDTGFLMSFVQKYLPDVFTMAALVGIQLLLSPSRHALT